MAEPTTFLARIKPYNGRTNVAKQFTVHGVRFQEERGWYRVNPQMAQHLRGVLARDYDPDPEGHKMFDVCTEAEALALDRRDAAKVGKALAGNAQTVVARAVTPTSNVGPREDPAPDMITTRDLRPQARTTVAPPKPAKELKPKKSSIPPPSATVAAATPDK